MRGDNEKLRLFESIVLRKIYESVFNNTEQKQEIRDNVQLYQLYKREHVVQFIRRTRTKCAGHVWQADGSVLKIAMIFLVRRKEPKDRPWKRQKGGVDEFLVEITANWEEAYDRE